MTTELYRKAHGLQALIRDCGDAISYATDKMPCTNSLNSLGKIINSLSRGCPDIVTALEQIRDRAKSEFEKL